MAEFADLLVGRWADPHMLAACMASLWFLNGSDRFAKRMLFPKDRHKPWMRYACDNDAGPTGPTSRLAPGLVDTTCPIAAEVVRVHRLMAQINEAELLRRRDGQLAGLAPGAGIFVRMGVRVTPTMVDALREDFREISARTLLWVVRTWTYADIVAPWRGVTEKAILQPQKAKPLPSPVPVDVRLAIEACLEANEPGAARQYYDGWRRTQLEPREEKA